MIKKLLIKISSVFWISPKLRAKLLNGRIGAVSQEVERINSNCYFCGDRITIQKGVFINVFCKFFSHEQPGSEIEIGENVVIGMGVTIDTHTHIIGKENRRASRTVFNPVKIGDGCWIGANSLILPGVSIGNGTIIGGGQCSE